MIMVSASIGFSGKGNILVYGIKPGQEVVLVDDLLSTGGTAVAIIEAIEKAGAIVRCVFFAGEKVNKGGREYLNKRFPNIEVISLVRFIAELENGVTVDADL